MDYVTGISDFSTLYRKYVNGKYNEAVFRFAADIVASRGSTNLVHWRVYITTTEYVYITSNKSTTVTFKASNANGVQCDITKEVIINTDINDEVVLAEGWYEYNANNNPSIYATLTFNNGSITIVDVEREQGTSYNSTEIIGGTYKDTSVSVVSSGVIENVDNFTDEDNVTITYPGITPQNSSSKEYAQECMISLDAGYTPLTVDKLPVNIYDSGGYNYYHDYEIVFTDEEREIMRRDLANQRSKEVFIFLTLTWKQGSINRIYRNYVKRTLSIVNGEPVLSPVVKDTNATTLALTGDENKIVRYHSNAYVASNVVLQKHAESIKSHLISVGGKSTAAQTYTFNAVEGSTFTFTATDSRGFNTTIDVKPPFVDYVKLTCNLEASPVSADSGVMPIEISGNYFSGSFGAYANNLGVSYRIKEQGASWGNWVNVSGVSISGNTYSISVNINGLNYQKPYELQAMATDRLSTITTPVQTLTTIPIFDWDKDDFNFNVPVALQSDLTVEGNTTLNGVLGVNGITNFTNLTNFESITTFDSTVQFNGTIDFGDNEIGMTDIDTSTITFDTNNYMADYIVETGTEAMGSNGTWRWQKWKSGKAECWGKRNYGNMSCSTQLYGSLYKSEAFTQALPSIFNAEPDVIDINFIKSTGSSTTTTGIFITRSLNASNGPSSTSTGTFSVCKNGSSGTLNQVHLGFHVIGTWK